MALSKSLHIVRCTLLDVPWEGSDPIVTSFACRVAPSLSVAWQSAPPPTLAAVCLLPNFSRPAGKGTSVCGVPCLPLSQVLVMLHLMQSRLLLSNLSSIRLGALRLASSCQGLLKTCFKCTTQVLKLACAFLSLVYLPKNGTVILK